MNNDENKEDTELDLDKLGMTEKDLKKLQNDVVESVIRSWFVAGLITIEDFNDKEELRNKLLRLANADEFRFSIDYTGDLLLSAKKYKRAGKIANAKLFYAIYFEHEINGFIDQVCKRKSIDKKTINDIIKSVNIPGKITWLLTLLGLPPITSHHKKILTKLFDDRNTYIHYKYNPEPVNDDEDKDTKRREEFRQIEKTLTYFKKYTSKVLYSNKKTTIDKHIQKFLLP